MHAMDHRWCCKCTKELTGDDVAVTCDEFFDGCATSHLFHDNCLRLCLEDQKKCVQSGCSIGCPISKTGTLKKTHKVHGFSPALVKAYFELITAQRTSLGGCVAEQQKRAAPASNVSSDFSSDVANSSSGSEASSGSDFYYGYCHAAPARRPMDATLDSLATSAHHDDMPAACAFGGYGADFGTSAQPVPAETSDDAKETTHLTLGTIGKNSRALSGFLLESTESPESKTSTTAGHAPSPVTPSTSTEIDRLIEAARCGNVETMRTIFKSHPIDVNAKNTDGWTALTVAARHGQHAAVEELIARGAAVDLYESTMEQTPLMIAARRGDADTVKLLLTHGANPDLMDIWGKTAFDEARLGQGEAVDTIDRQVSRKRDRLDLKEFATAIALLNSTQL